MNLFRVAMIKTQLKKNPKNVLVVPDPFVKGEYMTAGIPADRIEVLYCLVYTDKYLIMTRKQYEYYSRKERDLLAER